MEILDENRLKEWENGQKENTVKAQEMADFAEKLIQEGVELENAFQRMFDNYYNAITWQTYVFVCVILEQCWVHGIQLKKFRTTKIVPS